MTINYDEKAVTITGNKVESDETSSLNADSLKLLYTYENTGALIYYYESAIAAEDGYEYNARKIAIEYNGICKVFPIEIECDYYDDGELELAARFVLDYGTSCLNQKLFRFDYNAESSDYELCCLIILDFTDLIDEAVLQFYRNQYDLDYSVEKGTDLCYQDDIKEMYDCSLKSEEANALKYGDYEYIKLDNDGLMTVGLEVFEIFPEYDLKETGNVSFDISYLGKGRFLVEAEKYVEYSLG